MEVDKRADVLAARIYTFTSDYQPRKAGVPGDVLF
jgi:hypothetical protein